MDGGNQSGLGELLERSLRSPLPVTCVDRREYERGQGAPDEVVTTCRFILILKGSLNYSIEGNDYAFGTGTQFLIPSWCRRSWTATAQGCEIVWCEFDDDPKEVHVGGCFCRSVAGRELYRVKSIYSEMFRIWRGVTGAFNAERKMISLELEGQLKGMLSRFLPRVDVASSFTIREVRRLHPEIKRALKWLEAHYAKTTVLEDLIARSEITPNYFRLCFKEALLCSPTEYVKQLRLRHARYLLHQTDWQQKRIAAEVGYSDPLYFSRIYRQFWGKSPSMERSSKDLMVL